MSASAKQTGPAAGAADGTADGAAQDEEFVATRAWDSTLFLRLARYARPHWRLFMGSFAILSGLFVLELAGPWTWRHALDGPVQTALEETGADTLPAFALWMGVYGLIVIVTTAFRYLQVSWLGRTGQAVIHDLRTGLFRHIQKMDLHFFDRRPSGALVTRVTTDIENLNELFTSGLVVLFFDALKVVVLLGILFAVDARLATVVAALTPVLIGLSLVFRGGARQAHRQVRARLARLNGYLQEVLQGVRVVQIFRREERVSARFAEHLAGYLKANLRTILLFALFFPAINLAVTLMQAGVLWTGGASLASGELSFGEFIQFWFYMSLYVRPIRDLGERYNVLQSAFASAERIFQVLDTKPRICAPECPQLPGDTALRGQVRFEEVSFAYASDSQVLRGVSFTIPPGQTFAVVGATGAGKSTLVNLLLRFYDPNGGRITVDGIDLRDHSPGLLRRRMGLVLQEDFLFAGTVRENLIMEREEVDGDALALALTTSRADMLIKRLVGGLEAPVAERGATFSAGERQLLAIARALAGDPEFVILDEATSSIDSATEARIAEATGELLSQRTALVIAHRLSTVRRADRILVMHHGRLAEEGTHRELLAANGLYARLHRLQFTDAN
ncbi:MAG: ABC transporter ATP-binding protein [Planctomycetota bacterium]|nr:ABC transporter ATP-binding protein [Planctomycetota bacterium]